MSKKNLTYTQKIAEIESIIQSFESTELDFDIVREKVAYAVDLINQCKSEIKKTEDDIHKMLNEEGKNEQ